PSNARDLVRVTSDDDFLPGGRGRRRAAQARAKAHSAARLGPHRAGRSRGRLGTRSEARGVERPAGAAAVGHPVDFRGSRRHGRRHATVTLMRVAAGFGLGVVFGTLVGAITGYSGLMHRLIDPTLQGLRAIPSIAWVPLFILWFGIFEKSKIILIAVGVFFPVYLGVMGAVLSVVRKIV